MPRLGTRASLAVYAVVAAVAVSPCGDDDPAPEGTAPGGGASEAASATPAQISDLVEDLGTEEKVAQLLLVGFDGTGAGDPVFSALEERGYGGLVVDAHNYVSPDQVGALADEATAAAEEGDRLPPWIMAPQEGGEFNAFADLPPGRAPAEVRSPSDGAALAEETADALLDIGVNGILAPVLDVGPSGGGAVGNRAYSDAADRVSDYGVATLDAFEKAGIFSAAKHFPGLGGASQSTEQGPANVGLTLDQLADRDLLPFNAVIEAGIPGIVVGHGLYGVDDFVTPASMSEAILTDLLRDDLGFEGVAIADDLTAPAVTSSLRVPAAAVDAVRAGSDMVYVSTDEDQQEAVHEALLGAVRDGSLTRSRVDEAVTRTLVAKRRFGLLDELLEKRREEREKRAGGGGGGERDGGAAPKGGEEEPGADGESTEDEPAADAKSRERDGESRRSRQSERSGERTGAGGAGAEEPAGDSPKAGEAGVAEQSRERPR